MTNYGLDRLRNDLFSELWNYRRRIALGLILSFPGDYSCIKNRTSELYDTRSSTLALEVNGPFKTDLSFLS